MRTDIINEILSFAAQDEDLRNTTAHRSVFYCNSFESRIQLMQQADTDLDCMIMIDSNRNHADEHTGAGIMRTDSIMLFFCYKEPEYTDQDLIEAAYTRCEGLLDRFTAYLCTKAKQSQRTATRDIYTHFDPEQSFGAATVGPFDGGWVCYQMNLEWTHDIGCLRQFNRSHSI